MAGLVTPCANGDGPDLSRLYFKSTLAHGDVTPARH